MFYAFLDVKQNFSFYIYLKACHEPEEVSYQIKLSYYRQLVINLACLGFNTLYTILLANTIIFTNSLSL